MQEFGLIILVALIILFTFVGRGVGYDQGYKNGSNQGYKQGIKDGKLLQRQEQERAIAIMRTNYSEDTRIYEKRA